MIADIAALEHFLKFVILLEQEYAYDDQLAPQFYVLRFAIEAALRLMREKDNARS